MFKHIMEILRIFRKEPKPLPNMNNLQRLITICTSGVSGRKSRKYYLGSHNSLDLKFERQEVKDALARLQKV